jgi:hypothetical protein
MVVTVPSYPVAGAAWRWPEIFHITRLSISVHNVHLTGLQAVIFEKDWLVST